MDIHRISAPLLSRFRRRRIRLLYRTLQVTAQTRVLDIGGYPEFWRAATMLHLPLPRLTILNLSFEHHPAGDLPVQLVAADGTRLPFAEAAFDVAFSNSVIEHLCDWHSQVALAAEIRRVARRHFVQTPNVLFPVEPHYIGPFVHWFPPELRMRLLRNFTLWGLLTRPSELQCARLVREIRLLSGPEMKRLFPDSTLVRERLFGLAKDLIAIK